MSLNKSIVEHAAALSFMRLCHKPTAISLDDLVAAQIKKLEFRKAYKKGLMQQFFSFPEEVAA